MSNNKDQPQENFEEMITRYFYNILLKGILKYESFCKEEQTDRQKANQIRKDQDLFYRRARYNIWSEYQKRWREIIKNDKAKGSSGAYVAQIFERLHTLCQSNNSISS